MTSFEFIVDQDLRMSLESDWKELKLAFQNSAWKSVHVLAGSIIEAILVDHLLSINYSAKDPLKMTLDEAIVAGRTVGILSEKVVDLSTVVKRYRNLIHPGRALRLSEKIDSNGATICESLVQMIAGELAHSRQQTYGYTAEQIASKLERDPSAIPILSHLLKGTKEREIERLLLEVLPDRYFSIEEELWEGSRHNSIEKCFHIAFEMLSEAKKVKVAKQIIKVLHEEDGQRVLTYEKVFFRASHLAYLNDEDRDAVKQHLAAQLKDNPSDDLLQAAFGIGKFLVESEVWNFVDAAMRPFLNSKKTYMHEKCEKFISDLYKQLPSGPDQLVNTRLQQWAQTMKERDRLDDALRVEALIIDDVPF